MHNKPDESAQRIVVSDERDVIALRQEVRQVARTLGMGLTRQARITAAITAVARELLGKTDGTTFIIQVIAHSTASALEISCLSPFPPSEKKYDEKALQFGEARSLADEAFCTPAEQGSLVTLRMWV